MDNSKSYSKSMAEIFMCEIFANDIVVPKSGRVGSWPVRSKQRRGVENGMLSWTELKEFLKYANDCKFIVKSGVIFYL